VRLSVALLVVCVLSGVASPDASVPDPGAAGVPCRSVGDCWLDASGNAIKRPKRYRGKPLPRGDCGARINWLRNWLSCTDGRCSVQHVGDKC
jgi:hypothetical protein